MISIVLILFSSLALDGDIIELKSADTFSQVHTRKGIAQELTGNVYLQQDSLDLYCDHALYYSSSNNAELSRNVQLRHKNMTLQSTKLLYNGNTETATSPGNLAITQQSALLTAASGTYHVGSSRAMYRDSVVVADSAILMSGNMLEYYRNTRFTTIVGDVRGLSTNQELRFAADTAQYDPAQERLELTGNATIEQNESGEVPSSNSEPTRISAQHIVQFIEQGDTTRIAKGNVLFQNSDITLTCQKAEENVGQQTLSISGEPVFWLESGYGSADSIAVSRQTSDSVVITMLGSVFLALEETSSLVKDTPFHQIQCDSLVLVTDGKIPVRLHAYSSAFSVFVIVDSVAELGRQRTVSDEIHIEFEQGEPAYVDWVGAARGEVTPPQLATTSSSRLGEFYDRPELPRFTPLLMPKTTMYFRKQLSALTR